MINKITIGEGSCGIAAGALATRKILEDGLPDIKITTAGCIGMCRLEPIVDLFADGVKTTYVNVGEAACEEIIKLIKGEPNEAEKYLLQQADAEILNGQKRVVLANCGIIDPGDIEEYIERGGYKGFEKALGMTRGRVIDEIKQSGLSGRGGAGFPTWFKWNAALEADGYEKYVVCNADEGDPGAFMDRAVIEGDPQSVIEGMLTAAYAIGARHGLVYIRAEYPLAVKRLNAAIEQARERGFLGENILRSGFSFDIGVMKGAGAFVCGEETALIASLEGERGAPRLKPPFPAQKGFKENPTNINNVETYANVPFIMREGAGALNTLGTEQSRGTKVFAVSGKAKKGGLIEIPMGMTLREIIYGLCGGIKGGKKFKAVQLGGPSGGCLPESMLDVKVDYKELSKTGAIMGSGGMVVMDEDTCIVDMARFFLDFTKRESCGKCVHCRVGTTKMLEILEKITSGNGCESDITALVDLGEQIKEGALCGLGQTAPNPALTAVKYFEEEFKEHLNGRCRAKVCRAMYVYAVGDKCVGCGLCAKACPVGAVSGRIKWSKYKIDTDKCIKCGKCAGVCNIGAIRREDLKND